MPASWRDVVRRLAGPDAHLSEGTQTYSDGLVEIVAKLERPGAVFRIPGNDPDDAWCRVATELAHMLLGQSLMAAGWEVIEEVIDQSTYLVTRDPSGEVWAVAVGTGHLRAYVEPDMRSDSRAERVAFVDILETRSPEALMAALAEQV